MPSADSEMATPMAILCIAAGLFRLMRRGIADADERNAIPPRFTRRSSISGCCAVLSSITDPTEGLRSAERIYGRRIGWLSIPCLITGSRSPDEANDSAAAMMNMNDASIM